MPWPISTESSQVVTTLLTLIVLSQRKWYSLWNVTALEEFYNCDFGGLHIYSQMIEFWLLLLLSQ